MGSMALSWTPEVADHLQAGKFEVANQFLAKKLTARVAVGDTWGTAHACARHQSGYGHRAVGETAPASWSCRGILSNRSTKTPAKGPFSITLYLVRPAERSFVVTERTLDVSLKRAFILNALP
ncbi:hypothetical protein ACVJBD_000126 [Rhizobium mongolense]